MHELTSMFKALADDTRLSILFLIVEHGELCVCDIEHSLGISQSKASRHLRYLFNNGFLRDRREGIWVYYHLHDALRHPHQRLLEVLPEIVQDAEAERLRELLRVWLQKKECDGLPCD